ncbi:hypothetical protein NC652_005701 [Populus alba x Populus x berolinensis]|nr:hypothetical protein NC652_005701 [Populus alba x Populus x berolinensis]
MEVDQEWLVGVRGGFNNGNFCFKPALLELKFQRLAVSDPESCCEKLGDLLITGLLDEHSEVREGKSPLNFRLHSVHHLALSTYTTLASAYTVMAAYSLLLVAATYHLFCFESFLIASVANSGQPSQKGREVEYGGLATGKMVPTIQANPLYSNNTMSTVKTMNCDH